jgi:two-component system NtrC family sensor kinase
VAAVKIFTPGLRTEILLSLTLLLVAAMMLTSFVVMRITERDLLRHKAVDAMGVVRRIQSAVDEVAKEPSPRFVQVIRQRLQQGAAWIAASRLCEEIFVVGKDGSPWFGKGRTDGSVGPDSAEISSALRQAKQTARISRDRSLLTITAPLFAQGECIAAVQVPLHIEGVLHGLRRSRQLIWFYIGLNALVLLVFGNYLLSKIVIQPVKRLVKTADHFEDIDLISRVTDTRGNEIAHLTMSINRMLKRLAENRERMEAQIHSLEQANQELKEARSEILRSEKLSSVGRLAAGVAHEVGNPIGAILGYTNLLAAHVRNDKEARDYLTRMEKELSRIDTILRELLDFSRPSPSKPVPIDVNALVSETTSFFSHQTLMTSISLDTGLEKDAGMVWADSNQLKQVLINLMFNACDAMEEGGRLSIATRRAPVRAAGARGLPNQLQECIEIAVSDTGRGIQASELNKIFDPFYTTKAPGKGTGLGLAISLRIIESFHGSIAVESFEGKGSTFTIRLNPWDPKHDTE